MSQLKALYLYTFLRERGGGGGGIPLTVFPVPELEQVVVGRSWVGLLWEGSISASMFVYLSLRVAPWSLRSTVFISRCFRGSSGLLVSPWSCCTRQSSSFTYSELYRERSEGSQINSIKKKLKMYPIICKGNICWYIVIWYMYLSDSDIFTLVLKI